ncbi:MAG: transporter ATP-binding protein [Micavibrio sp.]|nr:transporter ATP-binding protein [Micavibrio sp.]
MSKSTERLKEALRRHSSNGAGNDNPAGKMALLGGTSLQSPRNLLRGAWKLIQPYWAGESSSKEKTIAYALLGTTIGLTIWNTLGVSVDFANWSSQWGDTLQNMYALAMNHKDWVADGTLADSTDMKTQVTKFWGLLGDFGVLAGKSLFAAATGYVSSQALALRWRAWSTDKMVTDWLSDDTFYRLQSAGRNVENPDQRIAEDVPGLTGTTVSLLNDGIGNVLTLSAFSGMLWGMSGDFNVASLGASMPNIVIPHFMFFAAIFYAGVGTAITHALGKKLPEQQFRNQRLEANFRSDLIRIRDNAEQIAMGDHAGVEKEILTESFNAVNKNKWELINTGKTLLISRALYGQLADPFPVLISLPLIMAGKLTAGGLRKTGYAFGQVQSALSWFIDNFQTLAGYKATIERLGGSIDAFDESKSSHSERLRLAAEGSTHDANPFIHLTQKQGDGLSIKSLTLRLPESGRVLLKDMNLKLEGGDSVVLTGPSGCGKSTLFRAIKDFWDSGSGEIALPDDATLMCSSQKVYLPKKDVRALVTSNQYGQEFTNDQVEFALREVGLDKLVQHIPGIEIRNAMRLGVAGVSKTMSDKDIEKHLLSVILPYVKDNIENVQSTSPELVDYLAGELNRRLASAARDDAGIAERIARRVDKALMEKMINTLGHGTSGFVQAYCQRNGVPSESRAIKIAAGMGDRLTKRFDQFFTARNLDSREITIPNKAQQNYLVQCLSEKMAQEFLAYSQSNPSTTRDKFRVVAKARAVGGQSLIEESVAGKLLINTVQYLRREVTNGETLSRKLSGGEQQRIPFARAILQKPDILLLDEPTSALDQAAGEKMYAKLKEHTPGSILISIAHNAHVIPFHKLHAKMQDGHITTGPVAANGNAPDGPAARLG